jgi:NTP pyrophosphohydrolases including oxidative damage repair enzymes
MGIKRTSKMPLHSRHRSARQEVAAVCYRMRKQDVEFLLVQTRGGRWIFPKGGVEPGLTHAQSAALEAFEEAGVHGKIEKIPFTRYLRRIAEDATKRKTGSRSQRARPVTAHLCQVSRLEPPQEENRNPTWFSAEKAKLRLRADRTREFGLELTRVVDRAVSRIRRLHDAAHYAPVPLTKDALREVRLEAFSDRLPTDYMLAKAVLQQCRIPHSPLRRVLHSHIRNLNQGSARSQIRGQMLLLGNGENDNAPKIEAIDNRRKRTPSSANKRRVQKS